MGTSVSQGSPRNANWQRVMTCYKNNNIPEERVLTEVWRASDNQTVPLSNELKSESIFSCYQAVESSNTFQEAITKVNSSLIEKGGNSISVEFAKRVIPLAFNSNEPVETWKGLFLSVIVLSEEHFEAWLLEGHAFAHAVHSKAVLLHGDKEIIQTPITTKNETALQKENNAVYTAGLNKAEEFLAGANLYRIREQNKMCAFMLHQAAEQALHTILQLKTGLRVVTHNLDKLYRYCCMVCYQLPEIILGSNKENDKRLFNLLQKAYIDTRYKSDYSINALDLVELTDIMRNLQKLLRQA